MRDTSPAENYAVIYSPEAMDDIREIYTYIAFELQVPDIAERQVNRIRKEIRALDFLPERYGIVDMYAKAYARDTNNALAKDTAARMIKKGKMSLEDIADCVPFLSMQELKKMQTEIMQTV